MQAPSDVLPPAGEGSVRDHAHRDAHLLAAAAEDDAAQRNDVGEVGAARERDVATVGELVVGRIELDPAVAREYAETQACETSAPSRRGRPGGGCVRR